MKVLEKLAKAYIEAKADIKQEKEQKIEQQILKCEELFEDAYTAFLNHNKLTETNAIRKAFEAGSDFAMNYASSRIRTIR